jgi:LysR family nitrogen assimilation transcriptional regulator
MEFRQIKYFLAIVEWGSISKAAARLFVAQSALSQQMVQLEEELGTTLLHRSPRGVSLTENGLAFYEHAKAIMRQIGDAKTVSTMQSSESPIGTVALGITTTASAALALPVLLATRKQFPGIDLQLVEESTGSLLSQLKQGRLNLAILDDDEQIKELIHKRIVEERLFLIFGAGQGTRSGPATARRVKLKDALRLSLVLPSVDHGIRQHIEQAASEHGFSIGSSVKELKSLDILRRAVVHGVGPTIAPLSVFQAELEYGLVRASEIHDPGLTRTLAVCTPREMLLTKASCAMSKLIVQTTRNLCRTGKWQKASPIFHDNPRLE